VRAWRVRRGISQEELAGRAGLHRTYVSDIERGARNISLESIEKLASGLEISTSTLFESENESGQNQFTTRLLASDELVDILLIEDNSDDAQLTLRALKNAGVTNRIHVARDGAEALDFLFCTGKYAHRQPSDRLQVILLDLELPKISGVELLRRIKADPRTSSVPVVVLTASQQHRDIVATRRLGAEAYIVKPVDFQNLSEVTPRLSMKWALLKLATPLNP
jgi:CheY-like chemotaxis protein/DNA-binding XRE family transcriptional regulator